MENGINGDQNFYSRRPVPSSPERYHQSPRNHLPPLPDFDPQSPQLPPKLPFLTTQNLQAATSNGFVGGGGAVISGGEPDQFYREYRGVQQSANGYTEVTSNGMPVTASESRQLSSLRSNSNGTTPRHPNLPEARKHLRPTYRSTSTPEERGRLDHAKSTSALTPFSTSQNQPSVKELLSRFNSNNEQAPVARKVSPRVQTNDANRPGYVRQRVVSQPTNAGAIQASAVRAGSSTREAGPSRVKSPQPPRTQRTRFATEDQHSNNTLSSTARAARPRNVISGNYSQASKSMTNLSPTTASQPTHPVSSRKPPLFGEVVSNGEGAPTVAYGIPRTASRRTSDPSLHPSWNHNRNYLDDDIDPSSPTSWYLGRTPRLDDVDTTRTSKHNRNHSDFADSKVNNINHIMPTFNTTAPTPTSPLLPSPQRLSSQQPTASRLPVSTHRYSGSSESSSMPSTRDNSRPSSPSGGKTNSRKFRATDSRPWSPSGRVLPTNRSRTPTRGTGRRTAKTPDKIPINNARLNAYISAPPPKLSPPLRSSRPRQPVSTATTASSRQKAVERSGSPNQARTGMRVTRTTGTTHEKPRTTPEKIIDSGPVDYEAQRNKIKRAYTRSINQNEQKLIREANLRRLTEMKDSATPTATTQDDENQSTAPAYESPQKAPTSQEPLHIDTSVASPSRNQTAALPEGQDSPTLGMPGTFVDDDEPPPSAISNATGTTDIENEPQTEAPRLSHAAPSSLSLRLSSQVFFTEDHFSPEQAMFGVTHGTDEGESIKIMLDATPVEELQTQSTPTINLFSQQRDPSPPGAFEEDYENPEQPIFSSVVTTASPLETTPTYSRASTPLESGDEQVSGNEINGVPQKNEPHMTSAITYSAQVDSPVQLEPVQEEISSFPNLHTEMPSSEVQDYLNTPVTDLDYDSSDGAPGTSFRENYAHLYTNTELQPATNDYRSSHQSSWTDVSVRSTQYPVQEQLSFAAQLEQEKAPTPPPKEDPAISPTVPPKPDGYSPQPSPRYSPDSVQPLNPGQHELPPLSTGDNFDLDFNDGTATILSVRPLWPTHPPPPPPVQRDESSPVQSIRSLAPSNLYNRPPPSGTYQTSQDSSFPPSESQRGSDDLGSRRASSSTPRSSTQISAEDVTLSQSLETKSIDNSTESEQSAKRKKDLQQRLGLVKETIDSEAVYLKDMNVVVEIYQGTAEACPKLEASDVSLIFRNSSKLVEFSTAFLDELKAAGASVLSTSRKHAKPGRLGTEASSSTVSSLRNEERLSIASSPTDDTDDENHRKTTFGVTFARRAKEIRQLYMGFLKSSHQANARIAALQGDAAVKVWLNECDLVAKDLTQAWNIDSLLIKPFQRLIKYKMLLEGLVKYTPEDYPDYPDLQKSAVEIGAATDEINQMMGRADMVGKIVGRKRKESDVRAGLAKAFGRRTEKTPTGANRPPEDEVYAKLHERFGHDYLQLQVVLRDVEFYTRQCTTYVNDFLRYLSAMELIMRMSASPWPELESKWARFNMSMRDMGTIALEEHIAAVRTKVIEPFENVIQAYGPPAIFMKKRAKRRLEYEKYLATKPSARDKKLVDAKEQYEALNETLKVELPLLSSKTEAIGNMCLLQFVNIQTNWYQIWQQKVAVVLEEKEIPKDVSDIVDMFNREYKYFEARAFELGIVNGRYDSPGSMSKARGSQSTLEEDNSSSKTKGRPSNLLTRPRGMSLASDQSPSIPTPDFAKGSNGAFTFSPLIANGPGLPQVTYPAYQPLSTTHSRAGSSSPATPDPASASRQYAHSMARPGTSRSHTSDNGMPRLSTDYNQQTRRESYNSSSAYQDGPPSSRPYSGLFNSALPDGPESQRSSRTSSRDRSGGNRFNVLYLAASLFEFNIGATKSEAGYPYLTYQAGEIFDVIGEKGELWLAKNQDDPREVVGWIWSKHFARLAAD